MADRGGLVFTLRKHRKKSMFGAGLLFYGFHYGTQRYREYLIRREYFTEAKKYGEQMISPLEKPRRLYVILNPTASNGKSKTLFQKNAAPILNLAGIDVTLVLTDYEGHGKTTVNYFDPTMDGVVVAGGDGALQEIVTGLFRQREEEPITSLPVGFIPLGTNGNHMFRKLFSSDAVHVRSICKAAMAVVKGYSRETSVMEVKTGQKSIYALANIHFGVHQQVKEKIDAGKYWLLGPLKKYFAFIWRTVKAWPPPFHIHLSHPSLNTPSASITDVNISGLEPRSGSLISDGSNIQPEKIDIDNFSIYLCEKDDKYKDPFLLIQALKNDQPRTDFIQFGWEWMRNRFDFTPNDQCPTISCTEVSLNPSDEELSYDIDGEIFDARPITVRIHPRKLNIFCYPDNSLL